MMMNSITNTQLKAFNHMVKKKNNCIDCKDECGYYERCYKCFDEYMCRVKLAKRGYFGKDGLKKMQILSSK